MWVYIKAYTTSQYIAMGSVSIPVILVVLMSLHKEVGYDDMITFQS